MSPGFVKLHRKFLEWEWSHDSLAVHLWVTLLLVANWKEGKWEGRKIKPGQWVGSKQKLAILAGLKPKQFKSVERKLEKLAATGCIRIERVDRSTKSGSIVTICNWDTYQHGTCDVDEEMTEKCLKNDEEVSPIKEGNNIIKKKYNDRFLKFWSSYPRKIGKDKAWQVWKRKQSDMPDLDTLLAAVAAWAASEEWQKDGGQYVPHPTTWLNRAGWEDEIPSQKGGGPGKFGSAGVGGSEDDIAAQYGS